MLAFSRMGNDMADTQPLKATFFAFQKREQSGVLLRLTIAFVIVTVVLCGAFAALFWTNLGPLVQWYGEVIQASARNDTVAIEGAGLPEGFFGVIGGMLLFMLPLYLLFAAYEAGCLRWMIHGESEGFMGLSLGAPTWRVWASYWIWLLLNIAFSIVMAVLMGVAVGVMTVSGGGDPAVAMTVLPAFYIFQYGAMIYFGIRLAPATATSVARRKFAFFDAWTVTKGRFLPLFGSFFLLYVLYFLATIAFVVVFFSVVLGASAPDLSAAANDPQQLSLVFTAAMQQYFQSLSNPQNWIVIGALQLAGVIVGVLFYLGMYGINARAAQAALQEGKITQAA